MKRLARFAAKNKLVLFVLLLQVMYLVYATVRQAPAEGLHRDPHAVRDSCFVFSFIVIAVAVDKCRENIRRRETQDREGKPGSPSS